MKERIKVYIIARISKDFHSWTEKVCTPLKKEFKIFIPKDNNPFNKNHKSFSKRVFDLDLKFMKSSDIGLILPEYGRDSAWEVGWYSCSKKPTIIFVDKQTKWLRDWMVKGGSKYIATINPKTYNLLKRDPILKHKKIILLNKINDLNGLIKKICN